MSLNSPPDRDIEKSPKEVQCRECSGKGYKTTFDDRGKPDGKDSCRHCNGSGFTRN